MSAIVRVLPYFEARQIAQTVACWLVFEREQGTFIIEEHELCPDGWEVGEDLAGACIIASFIVRRVLEARGYRAGVVYDPYNRHAYVLTECGKSIDVTIMQFPGPGTNEPSVSRVDWNHERAVRCYAPWALMYSDWLQGPSWPGYHREAIERILRRMGVEGLGAAIEACVPREGDRQ